VKKIIKLVPKIVFGALLFLLSSQLIAVEKESSSRLNTLSFEDLLNVTVNSAGKKNEQNKDIPASTMVITREEIEIYGFKDLRAIIDSIPGFYVMSNLGVDIYGVRGFTKGESNNFVVLINGVKITDDLILTYYQVPVDSIDRVEVVKGPMAVIYGNSAFFGVINIITNESNENKFDVSYGSFNTKEVALKLVATPKDMKIVLNVGYFDTLGIDKPLEKMISEPSRMDESLFGGEDGKGLALPDYAKRTKNFLQKSQKLVNFSLEKGNFNLYANYVDAENYLYYYFPSLNQGTVFESKNLTISMQYKNDISDSINYLSELRYSYSTAYHTYNHLFEEFYGNDDFNMEELDLTMTCFIDVSTNFDLKFGFQYENMLSFEDFTNVPAANIVNIETYYVDKGDSGVVVSGFVEGKISLSENSFLTLGVRAEKQNGYKVRFVDPAKDSDIVKLKESCPVEWLPRIAYIYQVDNNNIFKFLYGKSQKRPGYIKVGDDIMDIVHGEKNGKYVTPEYIETFEVNFMSSFADKFALNFSVFHNKLNDLIFQRSGIVDGILRAWWENSGEMESLGVESTLFYQSDNGCNAELSILYQNTDDDISKDNASFSPGTIFYFKFGKMIGSNYALGVTAKYIGEMEPFFDYTELVSGGYVGRTSYKVPGYLTISTNLRIDNFVMEGMYANFSCTNLLDKDILYPTFSINNLWADMGTVGEGRTFQFKIGYKY